MLRFILEIFFIYCLFRLFSWGITRILRSLSASRQRPASSDPAFHRRPASRGTVIDAEFEEIS